MKQTVMAMYDRIDDAQNAVRALKDAGFSGSDISLVAQDAAGIGKGLGVKTDKPSAAAGGATAGAVLGGIGGLLVGLGALVIPGIGPVIAAGPLAGAVTALVGAGAGAVAGGAAGGLMGALVDMGVPHDEAQFYVEGVRRGGALVSVHTDDKRMDQARTVLNQYNPINLQDRATQWRQSGWKGYDPNAQPYTVDQLNQERSRYGSTTAQGQTTTDANGVRVYTGR
jgi:hypothetical protein